MKNYSYLLLAALIGTTGCSTNQKSKAIEAVDTLDIKNETIYPLFTSEKIDRFESILSNGRPNTAYHSTTDMTFRTAGDISELKKITILTADKQFDYHVNKGKIYYPAVFGRGDYEHAENILTQCTNISCEFNLPFYQAQRDIKGCYDVLAILDFDAQVEKHAKQNVCMGTSNIDDSDFPKLDYKQTHRSLIGTICPYKEPVQGEIKVVNSDNSERFIYVDGIMPSDRICQSIRYDFTGGEKYLSYMVNTARAENKVRIINRKGEP